MDVALAPLQVWEALDVGPVVVEKQRIRMPYRIGDETEELVYRYAEDVLDPKSEADRRLACVIGAQVAMNYGLFAREIRFHGPFDATDRKFLRSMAENTAREIYVNKLRKPNPFLTLAQTPVVQPNASFRPTIKFVDPAPEDADRWETDPTRVLVLSSGGKDSLLSLGILEELKLDAHPIFVNESGRHWFTALNAWRHLEGTRKNAARVWSNCDRIFNWFVRKLPFVRPDFAEVRADIYPIRLWTVAVFLFGTLPLAKKRGLGRIVIGDEYDTSIRARYEGIPHYEGLFDQSRWFDDALTAYFRKKGWGLHQFSILRSVSELVILKTLLERYPDLQALQVSCHAAHLEGEVARPCGRCEKCRRMVGMITALGGDPSRCGYDVHQQATALQGLTEGGLKQLADDAAHLAWLLVHGGHLSKGSQFAGSARPHPETMAMRFDPNASPVTVIPLDLRPGVHQILKEHANGAVQRRGKAWVALDPLGPVALGSRGPFDQMDSDAAEILAEGQNPALLAEMTWPQAQARLREVDVAILPVGSIEQHGPHLPLDTDIWDVEYLARAVAAACDDPKPLVLPGIPYGVSYHHDDFPGTVAVGPDTLARMVRDVGMSAARQGIKKLVILNGHGGNVPALHFAAQLINRDAHIFTCVDTGETSDAEIAQLIEGEADVHAGEIETSTTLATRPHLVRMDHAMADIPRFQNRYLDFGSTVSVEWYVRTARISDTGTLGDPTKASAEKGKKIWEIQIRNLVEVVEHLASTPLDRLHRPEGV